MPKILLEKIKEAEFLSAEICRQADKKAEEILIAAHKSAREICNEAERKAAKENEATTKAAKEKAADIINACRQSACEKAASVGIVAEKNFPLAISKITEYVLR